eukprot:1472978-Pyramimonas_sp.AAC.2
MINRAPPATNTASSVEYYRRVLSTHAATNRGSRTVRSLGPTVVGKATVAYAVGEYIRGRMIHPRRVGRRCYDVIA